MNKMHLLSVVLMGMSFTACGGDDNDPPAPVNGDVKITATPEAVEVNNEAQSTTVTITSTAGWNISSDESWCTVFPSGGVKNEATEISVKVTAHTGIDQRVANLTVISGSTKKNITVTQLPASTVELGATTLTLGGQAGSTTFSLKSNTHYDITSSDSWCTVSPASGEAGEAEIKVTATANDQNSQRSAELTISYNGGSKTVTVNQLSDVVNTPAGYHLVWADEFNEGDQLDSRYWEWENWAAGNVNNELQTYIPGTSTKDGKHTTEIKDGFLKINCFKGSDGKIYSGRVNAKNQGKGWQYGYFESRILLPKGKGTWPAYWMMPMTVDWVNEGWPKCGEIDIMEEVGVDANVIVSSLHAEGHNHTNNTQVTATRRVSTAETEFHVYALEWTPDKIKMTVDGEKILEYTNPGTGVRDWPYDKPFHLIFNLAWGGDWGGYAGVDESALPTSMTVDYVRVFQRD